MWFDGFSRLRSDHAIEQATLCRNGWTRSLGWTRRRILSVVSSKGRRRVRLDTEEAEEGTWNRSRVREERWRTERRRVGSCRSAVRFPITRRRIGKYGYPDLCKFSLSLLHRCSLIRADCSSFFRLVSIERYRTRRSKLLFVVYIFAFYTLSHSIELLFSSGET